MNPPASNIPQLSSSNPGNTDSADSARTAGAAVAPSSSTDHHNNRPPSPEKHRALRPALLLVGILLLAANMRASLTAVSPLMGQIRDELSLPSFATSALISLPLLCFALVSPVAPKLAARIGIERTLGLALGGLTIGILLRSAPWTPGLWAGTVLVGSSIAFINVLLPALLKRDFPTKIGPLTGAYNAVQSGFAALAAGFAVPLAALPGFDWRIAIGCTAGIALIGLAVFLPQLRSSAQHRPASPASADLASELAAMADVDGTACTTAPTTPTVPASLWRSATAWQVTLFMGLQSSLFYSLLTWWPAVEHDSGTSPVEAGLHMALIQASGIVGSLCTGALLRRVNPRIMTMIPVLITATGVMGQLTVPSAAVLWAILLGLGTGGTIVTALALFGARTRDHHRAASLSGMAQSVGYLLAAAVPPLLGAIHDATGNWTAPLLTLTGLALVAAVMGMLASRDRTIN